MDGEGSEIDADAKPYRALVADGGDTVTFTGVAPNARAVTRGCRCARRTRPNDGENRLRRTEK